MPCAIDVCDAKKRASYTSRPKQKHKHIKPYNGIDLYNKLVDTNKPNMSENITFSPIDTKNEDKRYLYRGGNKMTSTQLNRLKYKIDMINKRENIRFLENKIHKDIQFSQIM